MSDDDPLRWSSPRQERDVRRMLRKMERLDRRRARRSGAAAGGGPRVPWRQRPRARATVAVTLLVLLLGGFLTRMLLDPHSVGTVYAFPDERAGAGSRTYAVDGGGSYAFIATQDGSETPVAYDPCRPLRIVVNERTAGGDADEVLSRAVRSVEDATGLDLVVEGSTDRTPGESDVTSVDPDDPPPVLLAWSDPDEASDLAGDVAGYAGSAYVADDDGTLRFVTGEVLLDGPQVRAGGTDLATAVLMHEIGHLVGLDHVDDVGELMYPYAGERLDWGPGDLVGLARLGEGSCA